MNQRIKYLSPKFQDPSLRTQGVRVLIMCSILVLGTWNLVLASSKIDSLHTLLKTNIHDTTRINTLLSLEYEYATNNPDSALLFATQAKEIAEKIKDDKLVAKALSAMGWDHYIKGSYSEALKYYFDALKIHEETIDKKGTAASLGNIGIVYRKQGDYPKALEYYFEALKMSKELSIGNKAITQKHWNIISGY